MLFTLAYEQGVTASDFSFKMFLKKFGALGLGFIRVKQSILEL